jgi:hypothetical protein
VVLICPFRVGTWRVNNDIFLSLLIPRFCRYGYSRRAHALYLCIQYAQEFLKIVSTK